MGQPTTIPAYAIDDSLGSRIEISGVTFGAGPTPAAALDQAISSLEHQLETLRSRRLRQAGTGEAKATAQGQQTPPLGPVPRFIYLEHRASDLARAIHQQIEWHLDAFKRDEPRGNDQRHAQIQAHIDELQDLWQMIES